MGWIYRSLKLTSEIQEISGVVIPEFKRLLSIAFVSLEKISRNWKRPLPTDPDFVLHARRLETIDRENLRRSSRVRSLQSGNIGRITTCAPDVVIYSPGQLVKYPSAHLEIYSWKPGYSSWLNTPRLISSARPEHRL
ncbi:hypothetical protein SAMN05216287_3677 [Pseudomonas kuykendallii]|uniref:Uncharacterized protein n=1 Tax=Pseudomonas kuykendallii TaxID=1007099 RepID=A0A1H3EE98_9PSED|nr:hypothetical protein SAMN05216287_3677 [Pseudomonas kuykendallii]